MLMLSNINVILSTYLQYADHTDLAILHIGVKGRRKEEKKRKEKKKRKGRFLELPRPMAGSQKSN